MQLGGIDQEERREERLPKAGEARQAPKTTAKAGAPTKMEAPHMKTFIN
jgi:hypothetical protein